ncbi:30S ribosomal protein S17e [Candidatus Bathyarchaeota archaeon]|nr:MAG: 30S ribosomal protein S17e [Candidatus Bathyarchaeota archaeon]
MGNVRPERVKRIARELLKRYPDKFTADYEKNKMVLVSLVNISSKKLRNTIAGYITGLVAASSPAGMSKEEEQSQ